MTSRRRILGLALASIAAAGCAKLFSPSQTFNGVESCVICHDVGRDFDAALKHKVR